jgi:glutathione peroxidase
MWLDPTVRGAGKPLPAIQGKGFSVLGLPCNQFAGQEPGTEQEIQEFCSLNYGVTFRCRASSKSTARASSAVPLAGGRGRGVSRDITWNFEKFLLGKDGRVLARFSPRTAPDDPTVVQAIEKALS